MSTEKFRQFKAAEIDELTGRAQELSGVWEASAEGHQFYQKQKELADGNLKRAQALLEKTAALGQLREQAELSRYNLQSQHTQWLQAETDMHNAIRPFSVLGIAEELARRRRENEDLAGCLRASLLDGPGDDINSFVRDYQRIRTEMRMQQYKLDKLHP